MLNIPKQTLFLLIFNRQAPAGGGKGMFLQDNRSGDSKISDFFMYHEKILKEHDRVFYGKYWYEIRAIEPWESSFMKFYKSYLVKVDGQK